MNWWKLSNKHCAVILLLSFFSNNAQNTLLDYKKEFPDYSEIILNDSKFYNISIENKKLKIEEHNYYESIILNENGILNNQESFSYSDLVQLKGYDAYTILSSNGKEKKIKVTQTNEKLAQQNSVFHSDVKQRNLIFPNLESGAKKVYDYQTEIIDPFLMHKFIFGNGIPIKNSTLEIKTEKDITIGFKIFNDPKNLIEFTKIEKKGNWIYKWTLKNIKPLKLEPNSPGYLFNIPHMDVFIKEYSVENRKIEVLDDVSKLYKYYRGFTKNLNQKEDPTLKEITLKLIEKMSSDQDKIKSIFYWVKDNIKYIAFENGYEGFIPREASLVCERKFGDCKDMSSIITEMAKYANIKNVVIAWIGTRSIPYSYNELATPGVDNHMIAVYEKNNEFIFLDATDKETAFGIPTAFIQDKETLISDGENYKVIKVPVIPAEKNEIKEEVKLYFDDEKLIGSGSITFNGYNRSHLLAQLGDVTNKTRFEMIKSLVVKGNNKFNLKEFKEENSSDRDKPYKINFNFDLDNYTIKIENQIYVNLFLDKHYENLIIEKDRLSKYEFNFLTLLNTNYELEIPKDYKIKYIPKNFNIENDLLKVDFAFENKNNKIFLKVSIKQKKIMLDQADFETWNETIKKIKTNYNETIILHKI